MKVLTLKVFYFVIPFVFFSTGAFSQNYTHAYYFDKDFGPVKPSKAVITGKGFYENGLFKLDCFNSKTGLLLMSAHFTDTTLSRYEGLYQTYDILMRKISEGNYANDQKQGLWYTWNDYGRVADSVVYEKGNRIIFTEYTYSGKDQQLLSVETTDSLKNTFGSKFFSAGGKIHSEAEFTGQRGILRTYDSTGKVITDSVYTRESREAIFSEDKNAWMRFLQNSLGGFNPADNGAPAGKYQVMVKFIVNTDGSIASITPETNFGYGMENTVVRAIRNGPKWVPAIQYGRPVKAYRRQPVTFVVEQVK